MINDFGVIYLKKIMALLLATTVVFSVATGCQPKKRKQNYKNAVVSQQKSESFEDAVKECFNASYSLGGGEVFYAYMYPNAAIDAMKQSGQYDDLISTFNHGQENRFMLDDSKLEYEKIMDSHEINDKQRAAAKKYLVQICEQFVPELTEDQLDIKEGYEVTFSHLRNGEADGKDTVLAIKLNDEGWKVITG